jgi:hypothetical protein
VASIWHARTRSWACNAFTAVSRRVGRCGQDACRRNMQGRGRACSELRPPAFLAMPWGSQDDRFPQIRAGRAVSCPFWLDGMRVWVTGGCMSRQRMDADTAETMARVVQLLRRAAELVWAAVDVDGAGSPRQVLGLASTWLRTRRGTCFRTRFRSTGRCRSGMNRVVSYGLLSSCCGA